MNLLFLTSLLDVQLAVAVGTSCFVTFHINLYRGFSNKNKKNSWEFLPCNFHFRGT